MITLSELFPVKKPVIGMIHLAGESHQDKVFRGLDELCLYDRLGIDGVIIEDYHGQLEDVIDVLNQSQKLNLKIVRGVNILKNPYRSFVLAYDFGARFVQFDSVQTPDLDLDKYNALRTKYPDIAVLGGVGFKYTKPTGNLLEVDMKEAVSRCEVIVTTGPGTGIETPIDKLIHYKKILESFTETERRPLFDGAGITVKNVEAHLAIVDGVIIGTYFKYEGDTKSPVDGIKVDGLVKKVRRIRESLT